MAKVNTADVTGRYSNQLNYRTLVQYVKSFKDFEPDYVYND